MPEYVDLETARRASGVRLVLLAGVPSAWSEAAKGVLRVKRVPFLAVRLRLDSEDVRAWTGVPNAPVVVAGDDPPRADWADILAFAEHLAPEPRLLPAEPSAAAATLGLCDRILGRDGLMWSTRILLIHASLTTDGREGFSVAVSRHLAARYGYTPDAVPTARQRAASILADFDRVLSRPAAPSPRLPPSSSPEPQPPPGGAGYLAGHALTAADIYLAGATACLALYPDDRCPLHPRVRHALSALNAAVRDVLPASLLAHRDFIYERHLELPIQV